jgi:hypothetical protein
MTALSQQVGHRKLGNATLAQAKRNRYEGIALAPAAPTQLVA